VGGHGDIRLVCSRSPTIASHRHELDSPNEFFDLLLHDITQCLHPTPQGVCTWDVEARLEHLHHVYEGWFFHNRCWMEGTQNILSDNLFPTSLFLHNFELNAGPYGTVSGRGFVFASVVCFASAFSSRVRTDACIGCLFFRWRLHAICHRSDDESHHKSPHRRSAALASNPFTTINALRLIGPTCVAVRLLEMLPGQAGPMGSGGSVEIGDSVVRTSGSFMIRRNTWLRLCVSFLVLAFLIAFFCRFCSKLSSFGQRHEEREQTS